MDIRSLNPAVVSVPSFAADGNKAAPTPAPEASAPPAAAAVAAAQARAQEAPDRRELEESVNTVNEAVKVFNSSVRFSIDEETKQRVIKVVDVEKDEVIRQIPSEEVLAIAKAFDKLQGLLIKDKA